MIELKNITYKVSSEGKEKILLDNISCVFDDNVFTAITGHNGSGKSTLTKIIMGILTPTSGCILYNGVDITNMSIDERARLGINYAFQLPITFRGISVKELIDIATNDKNTVSKACEMLSRVGICAKEYLDRNFDKTLSGGELKRIELALALAKSGNVYIFDEPEAGIDMWSFSRLSELFDDGHTYIVVSHQEKLLKRADKILVLKNGQIEYYDDAKVVLDKIGNTQCLRIKGE